MKKMLAFTMVFIACGFIAKAQIKKDAVLLGGQISFYNSKSSNSNTLPTTKNNNAFLNLSVGKAIKQNTVVGVYGGYGKNKSESIQSNSSSSKSTSTSSSAGVFYRRYKSLGKNFYFIGQINAGYSGYKQEYENKVIGALITNTHTENGAELGLTPGVSYQVYKKLQLEILMPSFAGVRYATTKDSGTNTNSTKGSLFQFNTSLNGGLFNGLAVGFKFVL